MELPPQKNYCNKSFRGKECNGFDFSNADIRGANFTNAKLVGANFTGAKAGLTDFWIAIMAIAAVILAVIAGVAATLLGAIVVGMWQPSFTYLIFDGKPYVYTQFPAIIISLFLLVYWLYTVWLGYLPGLLIMAIGLGGTSVIVGMVADTLHSSENWKVVPGTGTGAFVISMAVITVLAMTIASGLYGALSSYKKSKRLNGVILISIVALATLWIGESICLHHLSLVLREAKLQDFNNWFHIAVDRLKNDGVGALNVSRALVAFSEAGSVAVIFAAISSSVTILLGCYAGWQSIQEDKKFLTPRNLIIRILNWRGTNFSDSDLTDADFTSAALRGVDFSQVKSITRTNWSWARGLDLAHVGNTYLKNTQIRDLLVTKDGKKQKFDRTINLSGVNLAGAELSGVIFENTDLSEASLQDANLQGAKLLQVNLRATNLTRATLTEAFIQNCIIVGETVLDDVKCDYFFTIYSDSPNNKDPGRKPDNEKEIFTPGGFADFIRSLERTLDLFHDVDIDPVKIAIALNQLMVNNPQAQIELVGMERKGANHDKFLLRLKLAETANRSNLHAEYFSEYERLRALQMENSLSFLEKIDAEIHAIADAVRIALPPNPKMNLEDRLYTEDFSRKIGKRVTLKLDGTWKEGFKVTLMIAEDGASEYVIEEGSLPPATNVKSKYEAWQASYYKLAAPWRVEVRRNRVPKSVSPREDCLTAKAELKNAIAEWLKSDGFAPIKQQLEDESNLAPEDGIRFVVQTKDYFLRQLPWYLWDWFDKYKNAEPVLSPWTFKRPRQIASASFRSIVRILPIIGDNKNLNVMGDTELLAGLPNTEPLRFQVHKKLAELETLEADKKILFDERGWDFLYFGGHSSSAPDGDTGWLKINQDESLDIQDLKKAIKFSLERGLKLVFLNSCDGLGLERRLADMNIPQIIVMREPIPDPVAQEFLKQFLIAFAIGRKPLHIAVRRAREALRKLEDKFPCATMLPVTSQNLAMPPLLWHEFHGATQDELKRCLAQLQKAVIEDNYLLDLDPSEMLDKTDILKQLETLIIASRNLSVPEFSREARKAIHILNAIGDELPQLSKLREAIAQTLPKIKEALNLN